MSVFETYPPSTAVVCVALLVAAALGGPTAMVLVAAIFALGYLARWLDRL